MSTTLGRRLMPFTVLGLLAGWLLLSLPTAAMAQDEKAGEKPEAKKLAPTMLKAAGPSTRTPTDRGEMVGPVQPQFRRPRLQGPRPQARPRQARKRPAAGIPQPTVVLKPGEVPAIQFDTPIYDFGKVRAGPDIVHEFWFTNTGTGPLEILKVKPG